MSAHVFRQTGYMRTGSRLILLAVLLGYQFAVKVLLVIALRLAHEFPRFH